jgi:hypothetical protein
MKYTREEEREKEERGEKEKGEESIIPLDWQKRTALGNAYMKKRTNGLRIRFHSTQVTKKN